MTTTLDITKTAEEAVIELVATKLAIVQVLETLTGTSPIDTTDALDEWAHQAPVELPLDEDGRLEEEFGRRLYGRVNELEVEMLRAAGAFMVAKADRLEALRG